MRKLAYFVTQSGCVNCIYTIPKSNGSDGKSLDKFLKPANNNKLHRIFNIISSYEDFIQHVSPLVKVEPKCSSMHVCGLNQENGNLYFLTNEGENDLSCTVSFSEVGPAIQLDADTGKCWALSNASSLNGICSIPIHVSFAGSCLILFTEERIPLSDIPPQTGSVLLALTDGWSCRRLKYYEIGEHDFEIKEQLKEKLVSIQLGDWRYLLNEDFSGVVEYALRFECLKDIIRKAVFLDLGYVRYACEVFLNSNNLGKKIWHPFLFLITGIIKKGSMNCKL